MCPCSPLLQNGLKHSQISQNTQYETWTKDSSLVLDSYATKHQTTGFAYGCQETGDARSKELLSTAHVDTEHPKAGGNAPNLVKGNESKLASPVEGYK